MKQIVVNVLVVSVAFSSLFSRAELNLGATSFIQKPLVWRINEQSLQRMRSVYEQSETYHEFCLGLGLLNTSRTVHDASSYSQESYGSIDVGLSYQKSVNDTWLRLNGVISGKYLENEMNNTLTRSLGADMVNFSQKNVLTLADVEVFVGRYFYPYDSVSINCYTGIALNEELSIVLDKNTLEEQRTLPRENYSRRTLFPIGYYRKDFVAPVVCAAGCIASVAPFIDNNLTFTVSGGGECILGTPTNNDSFLFGSRIGLQFSLEYQRWLLSYGMSALFKTLENGDPRLYNYQQRDFSLTDISTSSIVRAATWRGDMLISLSRILDDNAILSVFATIGYGNALLDSGRMGRPSLMFGIEYRF